MVTEKKDGYSSRIGIAWVYRMENGPKPKGKEAEIRLLDLSLNANS